MLGGNGLGIWLDSSYGSFQTRIRWAFATILAYQGILWIWGAVIVILFRQSSPVFDWDDNGFGNAFAWYGCIAQAASTALTKCRYLLQVIGFQANYMFL